MSISFNWLTDSTAAATARKRRTKDRRKRQRSTRK